ncbi:tRNA pseudouridine13 synthase [Ectothiorhodosinus mongolicus]|uniref:tRNA pseudouridine synthase D n=1 Tax=Ectothiorhodosinus mongolicus TaxID=233100 RepID=A0A1R3VMQ0_9GAMM|nr:tRNA pseudouridine(13) synthase TruD [Ectothiorhodosinus mongolicus]ULX56307.1 tRNA pseudouridine(13) synthase TruD [Ectothiorhodosinus mongolicus]SIT65816.1 tRNA pseudouridine13 synthase [Ectothiorhodosinus mongolicus]
MSGFSAILRQSFSDFVVEECAATEPSGEGEHLWLWIEKHDLNTSDVVSALARLSGLRQKDIGYAGLKDRRAVTRQWFSLHLPGQADPDWSGLSDAIRVLNARRHHRKLRVGHLRGNRFEICLRECAGDWEAAEQQLNEIRLRGMPNFFGAQRFGRDGGNLQQARALFEGRIQVKDKKRRGLYLSAARSAIFNAVLQQRVDEDTWDQALVGDVMQLEGSGSFFVCQHPDAEIVSRIAAFDIHPSGPLWGCGLPPSEADVHVRELRIADQFALFTEGLCQAGLKQERRSFRVPVHDLTWAREGTNTLRLAFRLPAGAYATSVISQFAQTH